ncbi:hypothetical protein TTHERM_00006160 (macronuclear) [Tetrahymena thermophila SB210]|uniref:Uncharacterized protein n=1 Tax=Tetrahymena thermophila (strain SB210) TaxID=312017 RepID=Q22SC0_TETTS|nr:hypothetical protein TTHERM_00006160 [Tetrahymena thermophila SB210]EAR87852.1 hypothetical protein TTHERM_00006160 [Tetrahymena thermophila SB210]|eukprot:XP_001008097.1 hypothetical protein TTHERM_00006160 [Tetrahymena thermophila SB210]
MMKQFLFEQLSNSVQNTTNKLLTHLEDNQKIISLLDNLLNSMTNSQVDQMQIEQVQDDIEKISDFVSEILGTLDSCLFTLEYNTQKYVQHLSKKKDDIQALSNIDNIDVSISQNGRAQEHQLMRNNIFMGNYNNMKSQPVYLYQGQEQYLHDENEEDYSQNDYQQMNNGFNGIEGDDEDDMYDEEENDQIYLGEDEYNDQNQNHQLNMIQNKPQQFQQMQQQNAQQMYQKQQQSQLIQKNSVQTIPDKTKQSKFMELEPSSNNQKTTLNSNLNIQKQSSKTKTVSANLTVNDIFN